MEINYLMLSAHTTVTAQFLQQLQRGGLGHLKPVVRMNLLHFAFPPKIVLSCPSLTRSLPNFSHISNCSVLQPNQNQKKWAGFQNCLWHCVRLNMFYVGLFRGCCLRAGASYCGCLFICFKRFCFCANFILRSRKSKPNVQGILMFLFSCLR